jgi:hypothetical protein
MKKLLNKKVFAALLGLVVALGVVDLTVLEKSHLKPVIESLQDSATSLFDEEATPEAPAAPKAE